MATKTVINTNMPSTRGISILIDDQDHTKKQQQQQEKLEQQHSPYSNNVRQQQQQQQQQTLRSSEQKAENGKIIIYQNTTTTRTQMVPAPATAISRTVVTKLQPQPSKLVTTTTTKTQIGVNNGNKYMHNNDLDNNENSNNDSNNDATYNYYHANNERGDNDAHQKRNLFEVQSGEFVNVEQQKTGYSTIKQTITTSTAVPTVPHLLLKVMSERGKTEYEEKSNNMQKSNEEMHEANAANEVGVDGKAQLVGATGAATSLNRQSNSNGESRKISYTNTLPTNTTPQSTSNGQNQQHGMMIIQCNGNNDYQCYQHNEVGNDELSSNDERVHNKCHHHQVGSPTLVVRATASSTSNVDYNDDVYDGQSSASDRVTSVVAANGQNAFERICTSDQNGNKDHDHHRCRETTSKTIDCTTDDQQQLESKDVNAYTNVVNNNNSPIAKIKTTATTTTVIATTPTKIKTEANCASAVTETDAERQRGAHARSAIIKTENKNYLEANQSSLTENQTPLHVLKIQIKPQEEEVHTVNEEKQVTVVTVNELQSENLEQQEIKDLKHTISVHKFETNKSASESANNLQLQTINEKMVQKPTTTTNTVKTATPSANMMASTTILNSGAVSVTGGGGGNTTHMTSIKTTNANGNGNGNVSAHINGNSSISAHCNGNSNGIAHNNGNAFGNAHKNGNANCNSNNHGNGNSHTNGNTNGHTKSNGNTNGHSTNTLTSLNTSVTELNVASAHPSSSYLYYVMSSGQFSPCDTLDSGTGSDLESNGNITPGAPPATQNKLQTTLEKLKQSSAATPTQYGVSPKMELLLKNQKMRLNATKKSQIDSANNSQQKCHNTATKSGDHARIGSFTDSEESEASSLSCDSLHSTEFIRQSSASPPTTPPKSSVTGNGVAGARLKMLGSFLPDSLLRDIRDRKFPTNDFELKYGNGDGEVSGAGSPEVGSEADPDADAVADGDDDDDTTSTTITNTLQDAMNEQEYMNVEHTKLLRERNTSNISANNNNKNHNTSKRLSLPNKTFVFNAENGTFVDTKMDSMPRTYEADKYYNFHVKEHENFHSFDIGGGASFTASDLENLAEYDPKSLQDDAFAGYKDIRCGSNTSTIRSSKGTVRGVKNRVRNGIATFLQLQQPNLKNFKEKDAGKVVLYTTSMGIIRDTYAKCANVKQILRTLLVKFEERDVFMSIEYQQEIKERMHSEAIKVPQLFVEGQHIGDADTVERLNESGELRQLLKPYKSIATTFTCQTCGGYRLLPCPSCNGSKKSVHRNHFTAEFVALKCMNCDEVGLVKCHNC